MNTQSDATFMISNLLARLSRSQDQEAWSTLVAQTGGEVERVCRRIAGPGPLAEDAAQEAWIRIRSEAGAFHPSSSDPEAGARAWLRRIAATTTLMILRGQHRLKARERKAREPSAEPDPQAVILQRELAVLVRASLDELPERERLALTLRYFGDLDLAGIATEMGCPIGSVKSLMSRGLDRLSRRLELRGVAIGALVLVGFLEGIDAAEGPQAQLPATDVCRTTTASLSWKGILLMASLVLVPILAVLFATDLISASVESLPSPEPVNAQSLPSVIRSEAAHVAWGSTGFYAPFKGITPVVAGDHILAASEKLVVAFSLQGQRLWEVPINGYHHRPVVDGDRVFITDRNRLLVVELASGRMLWDADLGLLANNAADPVLADGAVYIPTRDGRVQAFSAADGSLIWEQHQVGNGDFISAVVADDALLVVDWQHGIHALALVDGSTRWRREVRGIGANPPEYHAGSCLVVFSDPTTHLGGVCRLDQRDGHELWRHAQPNEGYVGGPVISGDLVVATSHTAVVGLGLGDGKERWRQPRKHFGYESLIVDQAGRIILGDDAGVIRVLNAASGHLLAELSLAPLAQSAGAPIFWESGGIRSNARVSSDQIPSIGACGTPLPVRDRLYVITLSGWLAAIDLPGLLPMLAPAPRAAHLPLIHPRAATAPANVEF